MLEDKTVQQADLYFRLLLHTVMPLHQCLVGEMCKSFAPPLELATRLEDIGHGYLRMATELASTLIDSNRMDLEPDPDDYAEARIDQFVEDLFTKSGTVTFHDGTEVDGKAAMEAVPAVANAIKTALWLAKYGDALRNVA